MNRRGRSRVAALVAVIAVGIVLLGTLVLRDGAQHESRPGVSATISVSVPGSATASRTVGMARSEPVGIVIPAIDVDAPVGRVGLSSQGTVEVPSLDHPGDTGWYVYGPTPGENGPAVILGHVDSKTGPAVFFRLKQLKTGDEIRVLRADGSTAVFRTNEVQQVAKTAFPTEKVYGNLDHPGLRLITCGGAFDASRASYLDNIIVFADLVS